MKIGDLFVCTFQGDTASPPTNYVAEFTSIDPAAEWFSCRWVDNGETANFHYSSNVSADTSGMRITTSGDYQYQQIDLLLNALDTVLDPLPDGCVARSLQPPPSWGLFPDARVVGHVSLTAERRSDPWPPTCDWLRAR